MTGAPEINLDIAKLLPFLRRGLQKDAAPDVGALLELRRLKNPAIAAQSHFHVADRLDDAACDLDKSSR